MALTPTRRGVKLPDAKPFGQRARIASWTLLALLLGFLVTAVLRAPVAGESDPLGTTHALQAASLAHDLDLQYSKGDFDRYVAARGERPVGIFLRSPDRGERIAYGVPVAYAVATAPIVRWAPAGRGLWLANALFLALAAIAASSTLERRLGPTAPLWTATFVFASVAFAYTFHEGPELFAASLVALAFALAYRGEGAPADRYAEIYSGPLPGELSGRALARWIGAGLLAGTAASCHPFYLTLLLPLGLAVPKLRRRLGGAALMTAAVVALAGWGALSAAAGGSGVPWERGGRLFTPAVGFPAVDVPVAAWPAEEDEDLLGRLLPGDRADSPPDVAVLGWDLLFLVAGRHVGLLPWFLPLLLALVGYLGERGRAAILPAVGLALVGSLVASPFEFAGAAATSPPGNAFFLPLYPALWFLAGRSLRPHWPLAAAAVSALFLYPVWLATAGGGGAAGSPASFVAERTLPLETTQSALPGVGDVQHGALWVRLPAGDDVAATGRGGLRLAGGAEGTLWLGSPVPVASLALEVPPGGPSRTDVDGAELLRTVLAPDGGVTFVLDPGEPDRRHRIAWSSTPYSFYRLTVAFPEWEGAPVAFEIVPEYREPR